MEKVNAKIFEMTGSIRLSEVTKDIIPNSNYENFNTILGIDILDDEYSKKVGFENIEDIWKTNNNLAIKYLILKYINKTIPGLEEVLDQVGIESVTRDIVFDTDCTLVSSILYYGNEEHCITGNDLSIILHKFEEMTKDQEVSKDIHVKDANKYGEFMKMYGIEREGDLTITMLFLCSQLLGTKEEGDPRFFIVTCNYKEVNV